MQKTIRVVGYCRVSSGEQATEGVSLDSQREKVIGFSALHQLDLLEVIEDAGISAKSLDRPGLARALAMLRTGQADALVVAKLDRLSRNVSDFNALIDGYFSEKAGHQLMSVGDSIDTRSAAGRLVLNVLCSVAQWEREAIVERTTDAMRHKRSQGHRLGTIPLGWAVGPDGRTLVPEPGEREALDLIRSLSGDGLSYRRIAAELDARGIPTKGGGRKWSHSTVGRVLTNATQEARP